MSVSVRIPTILRTYTGGEAVVEVEPTVETLQGSFDALDAAAPGILARLLDDAGALRRFINIYINDDDVRFLDGLNTPTPSGVQISIVPAVAGG
jgi:molybdopterin converting factor small subunit